MSVSIELGILVDRLEDPGTFKIDWPNLAGPENDGTPIGIPVRPMSEHAFANWRSQPIVCDIVAHCFATKPGPLLPKFAPLDDRLIELINQLEVNEPADWWPWVRRLRLACGDKTYIMRERARWLRYWTMRARETFGVDAYIGFA